MPDAEMRFAMEEEQRLLQEQGQGREQEHEQEQDEHPQEQEQQEQEQERVDPPDFLCPKPSLTCGCQYCLYFKDVLEENARWRERRLMEERMVARTLAIQEEMDRNARIEAGRIQLLSEAERVRKYQER